MATLDLKGSTATAQKVPAQAFALLRKQADLALVVLLVAVVALFVLPLPTPVMDFLITSNLAVSILLLIVAIYVPNALSLSTFPSLLLFTTLFRLALNIASTKLILLHADAGQIINTFGKLIVGNNVVVGGVVFTVIAVVQFIVIAKGSERVAEVAARFALDAMPGKQMSIDAELRAGVLTATQAQQRRRALEQESQLHGAMDGAMKFVKGDAIAGIVIALVNVVAGVAVGTLMKDLSVGDALQRYAVLTVGDGMVSQIPSLLVSIAAGIVITRVTSSDDGPRKDLASQIVGQVVSNPRALAFAAIALGSFLVVQGFPLWTFAFWVAVLAGLGYLQFRRRLQGASPGWISHHEAARSVDGASEAAITAPVMLLLAPELREQLDLQRFDRGMVLARERAEIALGPFYPRMQLRFSDDAIEDSTCNYRILVQDVPVAKGRIEPGRWWVPTGGERAAPAASGHGWSDSLPGQWVEAPTEAARAHSSEDVLVERLDDVARTHAARLIGLQEVQQLMHRLQSQSPDLVTELSRQVPVQRIAEVLRRLLQEGIPIRNLQTIFQSIVRWAPQEADDLALTELIRIDLGPYITSRHVGADRALRAILFETPLLDRIVAGIERSSRGNLLLLSTAVKTAIQEQLRQILDQSSGAAAVIVSVDCRRYVRNLLEPVAPGIAVLSYQELDDDVTIQPLGWIANPPME